MRTIASVGGALMLLGLQGCSSSSTTVVSGAGGSGGGSAGSSTGGSEPMGGSRSVGGAVNGGASATGGRSSTAGTESSGGAGMVGGSNATAGGSTSAATGGAGGGIAVSVGGTVQSGGASATTGGTAAAAGSTATGYGGTTPTGGAATGGAGGTNTNSAGGAATGGTATGGTATGGAATGGTATGGAATGGMATGGAATGGAATGGAPALSNGQPCSNDVQCASSNCRLAPNSSRFCVAVGNACATPAGVGVAASSNFCSSNSSYACTSTDVLAAPVACTSASMCQSATCDSTTGSCALTPANQGALCPLSSSQGACDNGVCTALRFVPPSGSTWTNSESGPVTNAPSGCGTSTTADCAIGDFKFPWPPDTRQAKCYNDTVEIPCPGTPGASDCSTTPWCGQDAQYGVDVTRPTWATGRFVQSGTAGNDIVTDGITGLVWTVSSSSAVQMPLSTAQQFCNDKAGAGYGGRTDWNLPTIQQWFSLFAFTSTSESTPSSDFPGISLNDAWSRSTTASDLSSAWFAYFAVPYIAVTTRDGTSMSLTNVARCSAVGNVTAVANPRYYVTGSASEGVIFDARTNLLWQQTCDATGRTWSGALAYCEALTYGGRSDWRLPNAIELASIVDYSRVSPAIDPVAFPNTDTAFYWSSTTMGTNAANAWPIRFLDGTLAAWTAGKTGTTNVVRCVSGGPT